MVRVLAGLATAGVVVQFARLGRGRPRRARQAGRGSLLLAEAGAPFGAGTYAALRAGCAVIAFLVAHQLTGAAAVAVPPALAASGIPRLILTRRRDRRRGALQTAWPDGLRDLAASVAAGMSLPQAVEALAQTGPEELRRLLVRVPVLLPAIGLPATLERVRVAAADPATDRVVEVLQLAHERGGRMLPALLGDLAEAAARDVHLQERTATAQLELRLNARAVFALPWVVLCLLTVRPGPFRDFYASSRAIPVVAVAALLSFAGITLVERMARVPAEPRVFTGGRPGERP